MPGDIESIRQGIAEAKGLPADRLRGDTAEDIEADADDLLAALAKVAPPPPPPDFDGGARTPPPIWRDPNEQMTEAIREGARRVRGGERL